VRPRNRAVAPQGLSRRECYHRPEAARWHAHRASEGGLMADRDAYEILNVQPAAHQLVIQAAYRVLAALYHPDRDDSDTSTHLMAELNVAYDKVRTIDRREMYDRVRSRLEPPAAAVVTPYHSASASEPANVGPDVIDFGRYNGWTIRQLAYEDPDYLRWLSRHSSGIRYRQQIEIALRAAIRPSFSQKVRGR
jgi:curved DNA-binding protein CbpA